MVGHPRASTEDTVHQHINDTLSFNTTPRIAAVSKGKEDDREEG